MKRTYDEISVTERSDDVVLWLPDGSSVAAPQATIRRTAVLQEAIKVSDTASSTTITLPRGILQDWLQSIDALRAAEASTGHALSLIHISEPTRPY